MCMTYEEAKTELAAIFAEYEATGRAFCLNRISSLVGSDWHNGSAEIESWKRSAYAALDRSAKFVR